MEWPDIPEVEMVASLSSRNSAYTFRLHKSQKQGWFVVNDLQKTIPHAGDLVTHYFFLLKFILGELDHRNRMKLGIALSDFRRDLFVLPNSEDDSPEGLRTLMEKANYQMRIIYGLTTFSVDHSWLKEEVSEGEVYEKTKGAAHHFQRQVQAYLQFANSHDELWYFSTPSEFWTMLCGRAGYVIVRDGEPIDVVIITMMN